MEWAETLFNEAVYLHTKHIKCRETFYITKREYNSALDVLNYPQFCCAIKPYRQQNR